LVGAVAQAVDGGDGDQLVAWKRLSPLAEIKVAGDNGGLAFVAFVDDLGGCQSSCRV